MGAQRRELPIGHPSRSSAGAHVHSWCSGHECYAGCSRQIGSPGQRSSSKPPDASRRYRCYAVDDRPWAGPGHPVAVYTYTEDRKNQRPAEHLAGFRGVLQVDGFDGFKRLAGDRADASVTLAFCWAHLRRPFYEFFTSTQSPLAAEVLARIGALYAIEAEIRGHPAEHRRAVRQARSRPIVEALHDWLQVQVNRLSGGSDLAKAIRYALRHWPGLVVFLEDGRVEMDTNVVERAIRPHTLTRKNALFAGSDGGARHWAVAMSLIQTAKLNGINPLAWLTDVLERMVSGRTKQHELHTLLPWTWKAEKTAPVLAVAA
ncbi:MAG: IS66 family transposase [Rhodospirillales bacterium]|nr:IS66 family transposase [Acetobacter sp.]